jgi:hypothetical protein
VLQDQFVVNQRAGNLAVASGCLVRRLFGAEIFPGVGVRCKKHAHTSIHAQRGEASRVCKHFKKHTQQEITAGKHHSNARFQKQQSKAIITNTPG